MKNIIIGLLAAAVAILVAVILSERLDAAGAYPPIADLQQQLNIYAGAPLPKLIVWGGRSWQPYYVGASGGGNGRYNVTIVLR